MIALIISEIDHIPKKIAWVNEDSTGVYFGFFGEGGIHYSYHCGVQHIARKNSDYLSLGNNRMEDIKAYEKIGDYGIELTKQSCFATNDYTNMPNTNIIKVDPEKIKDGRLDVYAYLVRNGNEGNCIDHLCKLPPTPRETKNGLTIEDREIFCTKFLKLNKFSGFQVGIFLVRIK